MNFDFSGSSTAKNAALAEQNGGELEKAKSRQYKRRRARERVLTIWIDLTRKLGEGIPVYPGDPLFQSRPFAEHSTDGFRGTRWSFGSHVGTHLDAPFHYFVDGETLDSFPIEFFCDVAAVLNLTRAVGVESERAAESRKNGRPPTIEVADLEPFEPIFDEVPFVFLRTGWAERFGFSDYYNNFPSLTPETVDWLADFPKLRILGLETPSLVAFPFGAFGAASSDVENTSENVLAETVEKKAGAKFRNFDQEFLPEDSKKRQNSETAGSSESPIVAEPLNELELCADAECHRILLGRVPPILILEGLVGLEKLPAFAPPSTPGARVPFDTSQTVVVSCFPLLIERADGCPVRVAARVDEPPTFRLIGGTPR